MASGVIIAAHGEYAKGVKSGLDLVVGEMPNLRVVNFLEGDNYEVFDEALTKAYDELKEYDNTVFLTDLKGGTPFNRSAILFGGNENVRVLSGLNFALVYQALISETSDINEYVEEIIEAGKKSIDYFELPKEQEEQEETDGI